MNMHTLKEDSAVETSVYGWQTFPMVDMWPLCG